MGFKDSWRNVKFWIKGGILGSLIPIFLFFIFLIVPKDLEVVKYTIGIGFMLLNYWLSRPISHFTNCLGENCWVYWFYISFIISIIEFFIIGVLLSHIIKKIKK